MEAAGHLLVKDSMPGAMHCVPLSPALQPWAPVSTLGLEGPNWVGPGPDRGRTVSKEFRDVRLVGSARQSLGSLGALTGHDFGNPGGVCTDVDGSVTLFPKVRAHLPGVRGAEALWFVHLRASSWLQVWGMVPSRCTSTARGWPGPWTPI